MTLPQRTEAVIRPCRRSGDAEPSRAASRGAVCRSLTSRQRPVTILLADDDEEDRELARDALQDSRLANEMRFVVDGQDLMDYLRREGRYAGPRSMRRGPGSSCWISTCPRRTGARRWPRSRPTSLRRIPVVVLTTSKDEEDVLRTYDLGVNSFITKPVTFAGLVEVMRTWTRYWFEIVELPNGDGRWPPRPLSRSRSSSSRTTRTTT